jgi:hypothetical protein
MTYSDIYFLLVARNVDLLPTIWSDLLLIPQSFDSLAAFHSELLQAILFIAV